MQQTSNTAAPSTSDPVATNTTPTVDLSNSIPGSGSATTVVDTSHGVKDVVAAGLTAYSSMTDSLLEQVKLNQFR